MSPGSRRWRCFGFIVLRVLLRSSQWSYHNAVKSNISGHRPARHRVTLLNRAAVSSSYLSLTFPPGYPHFLLCSASHAPNLPPPLFRASKPADSLQPRHDMYGCISGPSLKSACQVPSTPVSALCTHDAAGPHRESLHSHEIRILTAHSSRSPSALTINCRWFAGSTQERRWGWSCSNTSIQQHGKGQRE